VFSAVSARFQSSLPEVAMATRSGAPPTNERYVEADQGRRDRPWLDHSASAAATRCSIEEAPVDLETVINMATGG
jgi:hypothetical protein